MSSDLALHTLVYAMIISGLEEMVRVDIVPLLRYQFLFGYDVL
jgi:hypothetical protein